MAIYDVDAINEQELAAERDDILDNMLEACDQMLSALGESGGAHQKYAKLLAEKDKALKKKIDDANYVGSGSKAHEKLINKYKAQRDELAEKAEKYVDGGMSNAYASTAVELKNKIDKKDPNRAKTYGSYDDEAGYRYAKNNFKRDFGGPGGEDPMVEKAKRQEEIRKKRAIKETCLTILSVLDEI